MLTHIEASQFLVPERLGLRKKLYQEALAFYDGAIQDSSAADVAARIDRIEAIMEAVLEQVPDWPEATQNASKLAAALAPTLERFSVEMHTSDASGEALVGWVLTQLWQSWVKTQPTRDRNVCDLDENRSNSPPRRGEGTRKSACV